MSTDLAAIRLKVRRVTKSPSSNQITDVEIDDYVNTFYLYDFPEHFRLLNLKETFTLTTKPDIDIYDFTPNTIVSIEPPAYIAGFQIQYFQSRQQYFDIYPEIERTETLTSGDGTAGPYSGTVIGTPVKRNRVLISAVDINGNALSAKDTIAGTFEGDVLAGSTIDYITGAIGALTWTSNVALGSPILVQSVNYQRGRPQSVLFYDDKLQFSPVPDQAYKFSVETFSTPTALANAGDVPILKEWWQLLAYGAALKIFADRLDMESYAKVNALFEEQKSLVERRTMKQLSTQRASTIYSEPSLFRTPFSSGN